jgi:uncharacterized surface protein with fasciclin (FAS1) repeats
VEAYNSSVISGTNVTVNKIDTVLHLPVDFDSLFTANSLNSFRSAAQRAGILPLLNYTHGITIFAPNDAAFASVSSELGSNTTQLKNILLNHVLNGSVLYSSEFVNGTNLTSASGEPVVLSAANSTIPYFTSSPPYGITANSSSGSPVHASIVTTDIISWSGVLHIIDTVLLNNATNPGAASSAYQSATSSAARVASAQASGTSSGLVSAPSQTKSAGMGMSDLRSGAVVGELISVGAMVMGVMMVLF